MPKTFAYFSLAMSIFFMVMAVFILIVPPDFLQGQPTIYQYGFSGVIFAYGMFRFVRARKWITKKNDGRSGSGSTNEEDSDSSTESQN